MPSPTPGRRRGLSPSIIAADYGHFAEQLAAVEGCAVSWHVDVMDGHYVPNLTIGPDFVRLIDACSPLPQDVHLMVANPDSTWRWYADAGAARIAFHPETSADAAGLCEAIRAAGVAPGVAVNPDEELGQLEYAIRGADFVIVMSVRPGFAGQSFIPAALPKLQELRQRVDEGSLHVGLVVDGGVNTTTGPQCVEAGADILVAASAVFGADDPAAAAAMLHAIASEAR